MTPWHRNEYILKGIFLGLWVFFALQVPADRTAARIDIAWVLGWVCTGLLVGLVAATALQLRRGLRPGQNWLAFPVLVLLESPTFIYSGIVLGLAAGVLSGREFSQGWAGPIAGWFGLTWDDIKHTPPAGDWLGYCAVGGALLGFGLYRFRQVEDPRWRFGMGLGIAALMVYLAAEYVAEVPGLNDPNTRFNLGVYVLLGLPFFYLLTFCGEAEESEAEIMTLCAALGVALHLMNLSGSIPGLGGAAAFLLPITIYFVYATRVLPGLRVFKHTLRGFSYMNLGKLREAIYFFRRALTLDVNNQFANQGLLALHRNLTLDVIERHPELVEELDFAMCLDRAQALLMQPPTAAQRAEAEKFLELVERKKPAYLARVDYLRAVSALHAKDHDGAAAIVSRLLNPEEPYHPAVRKRLLYDAWKLALTGPAKLVERVGWKELDKPGRRVEAIGAVERHLAADPQDAEAQGLKQVLYSQLTESEFVAAAAAGVPKDFNYEYVEQLGLALLDDPDPDRRDRGMAYLRMAGRGMPERGPGIFRRLADTYESLGDRDNVRKSLETAKKCGLAVGPGNLAKDQRELYFAALRKLAEVEEARADEFKREADAARDRGDTARMAEKDAEARPFYEEAIDNLRLYLDGGGRSELETYRKLADLYGKARAVPNAVLNALLNTETGLTYNSTDADLLKKKDTFYYSVDPGQLAARREQVKGYFDVGYCVRKAMAILNAKGDDPDLLDWAAHLARLAEVMQPEGNGVRLVRARCLLRRGERDAGIQLLEDIREGKKGSGDEEDAWYAATKILGQLYLDELNRPDLAVKAFHDYKEYSKSGADTLFQIARAYESLGDLGNAAKFYNAVTAYEAHPRYWDAKEALRRLGKE